MAPKQPRKLKVFQARFGFHDTVVATTSQAAALRVWDVRQNLFASGDATLARDECAIAAAMKHPETPLRRLAGSNDPFKLESANLPEALARAGSKPTPKAAPARPPKSPPDRRRLDAAEAASRELDEMHERTEADLQRRQDALDAAKAAALKAYLRSRDARTAAVVRAREAFQKAGGEG